jgi:tetratricopeptide (TPR) repeat protein
VNVSTTLTNLGTAYRSLGDAARAKELLERSLAIQEAAYGADHVEVAATLVCLGNAYSSLGDAARAKELYERALAIKGRSRNTHA